MFRPLIACFAAAALTALAAPAVAAAAGAQDDGLSSAWHECLKTAHAHRPIAHCNAVEIDRLEASIDAQYKTILGSAHRKRARERLAQDQERWTADTEAKCLEASRSNKGEIGSMRAQDCYLDAYAKRDRQLRALTRPEH